MGGPYAANIVSVTPPLSLSLSLSFCLTLLALSFSGKCYRALACVAELAAAAVTIELFAPPPPRSLLDRDGVTGIKESWALGFDRAINIITEARFFRKQALSDTLRLPSDLGESFQRFQSGTCCESWCLGVVLATARRTGAGTALRPPAWLLLTLQRRSCG